MKEEERGIKERGRGGGGRRDERERGGGFYFKYFLN